MKLSQEVKIAQTKFAESLGYPEQESTIFLNVHTLRLSKYGRNLLENEYDCWTFDSPGVSSRNIIKLNRVMTYPYYIDKKVLVLFTEKDAFMAKIANAQNWLDGKER